MNTSNLTSENAQPAQLKNAKRGGPILTPSEKAKANPRSMRAAINAMCFQCVGNQKVEVTRCEMTDCPLWNLRPWQK